MDEPIHFCAVTSEMAAATAAWRKRRLSWAVDGEFPTLGDEAARAALAEAFANWAAVCGLTFVEANDTRSADIVVTTGRIDGPLGVLAWSELPSGDDRALTQKYDSKDRFVVAVRPPRDSIDLVAVATHEIGHALGLDHTSPGTGDLMEPTYAPGRRTPQPGDVARVRALYGPATAGPSPTPGTARVASRMVILDQLGQPMASYAIRRDD